jgi:hypothetical protein
VEAGNHIKFYNSNYFLNVSRIFTAVGFFKAWKKAVVKAEQLKVEMMTL